MENTTVDNVFNLDFGNKSNDISFGSSVTSPLNITVPTSEGNDISAFKPLNINLGVTSGDVGTPIGKTEGNPVTDNFPKSDNKQIKVDDVWGTGGKVTNNSEYAAKQGDYSASSNEKSNVETSTLGKSENVSTLSDVKENKVLVGNDSIDSVEGLDFKNKNKEGADVVEARKRRENAEKEDDSATMKNRLRNLSNKNSAFYGDSEWFDNSFQIGDDVFDRAYNKTYAEKAKQLELEGLAQEMKGTAADMDDANQTLTAAEERQSNLMTELYQWESNKKEAVDRMNHMLDSVENLTDGKGIPGAVTNAITERSESYKNMLSNLKNLADTYGVDVGDISNLKIKDLDKKMSEISEGVNEYFENKEKPLMSNLRIANEDVEKAQAIYDEAKKANEAAKKEYDDTKKRLDSWENSNKHSIQEVRDNVNKVLRLYQGGSISPEKAKAMLEDISKMPGASNIGLTPQDLIDFAGGFEPATEETVTEESLSDYASRLEGSDPQAAEHIRAIDSSIKTSEEVANAIIQSGGFENADPSLIAKYVEAVDGYNKNIKGALDYQNPLFQTDYNREFTGKVAGATDFKLSNGQTFSEFMTDAAVQSPRIASGLYQAKANELRESGHPVLAKIQDGLAKISQTFLGSKITFADNKVRNQFNAMADANMRATYATYNNVLNDPSATDEQKAAAQGKIAQANSLSTASAALKASTGFWSGIEDDVSDGVYGVNDPTALNDNQKGLAMLKGFAQVVMGLGVSPGANEAYQTALYLTRGNEKVQEFFNHDFDDDGFSWTQEYGNSATAGLIVSGGELTAGVALLFNPGTQGLGVQMIYDSISHVSDALYGVRKQARNAQFATGEVAKYWQEAKEIVSAPEVAAVVPPQVTEIITTGISEIENFGVTSEEVSNVDNWLEGTGSSTASNNKFNQALTYDEWLKLIENDETMKQFARGFRNAKKNNVDKGVNA